jgi:hypothetical protein
MEDVPGMSVMTGAEQSVMETLLTDIFYSKKYCFKTKKLRFYDESSGRSSNFIG